MATVKVPVDGETLRWARLALHMSAEELGKAANLAADRIAAIESQDDEPTYAQLIKLAKKLDRPTAFFLTVAPRMSDVPATADFRGGGVETPALLARELKRAEAHRRAFLELERPNRLIALPNITRANVATAAASVRKALGLEPAETPSVAAGGPTLNYWRGLLEAHGFLIFQTTGIPLGTFRGASVEHDELPIILLNGADSAAGKVFTLFHELAHLANRTSGLCLVYSDASDEALCNIFAAEFLMPAQEVKKVVPYENARRYVDSVAGRFKVSALAAAVRLRTLGKIADDDLTAIRAESDADWQRSRAKMRDDPGFVPPATLRYRDLGPTYVGTVLRAVESERISILDATYYLDAKVPTVEKLFDEYHRSGGAD